MEEANKAFLSGLMVYLYDPQPKTISIPLIQGTEFKFRYILSEDAKEVPATPLMFYVDLSGNTELKYLWNPSGPDWNIKTGSFTLSLLGQSMSDFYDQSMKNDGIEVKHITPACIVVVLVGLEQQGDITVVGSKALSNTVRIQVVP
jgi:hypothetical protein